MIMILPGFCQHQPTPTLTPNQHQYKYLILKSSFSNFELDSLALDWIQDGVASSLDSESLFLNSNIDSPALSCNAYSLILILVASFKLELRIGARFSWL